MLHFELEFGRHSGVFTTEGKLFAAAANPQCCGKMVVAGDWRRGSALPSHGRGHWFDPSIAHKVWRRSWGSPVPCVVPTKVEEPFIFDRKLSGVD